MKYCWMWSFKDRPAFSAIMKLLGSSLHLAATQAICVPEVMDRSEYNRKAGLLWLVFIIGQNTVFAFDILFVDKHFFDFTIWKQVFPHKAVLGRLIWITLICSETCDYKLKDDHLKVWSESAFKWYPVVNDYAERHKRSEWFQKCQQKSGILQNKYWSSQRVTTHVSGRPLTV